MGIPQKLRDDRFRFVKLRPRDKKPFENDWVNTNNYSYKEIEQYANAGNNYGVIGGYGHLLVVDFDDRDFENKVIGKLPDTFTVETGSGGKHLYYFVDVADSQKIMDSKNKTLADIQGVGKQVVGPGSIHPNGKPYIVKKDIPIASTFLCNILYILKGKTEPPREILKNKKTTGKTNCIFHSDKNASLTIYDDNFFCFGCRAYGDIKVLDEPGFAKNKQTKGGTFYYLPNSKITRTNNPKKAVVGNNFNKSEILMIDNYIKNVETFRESYPFFYDKVGIFWFWNKKDFKWDIYDEIDIMNLIDSHLGFAGQTVSTTYKNNYKEAFKRVGRKNIPKTPPTSWIQFKETIYDLENDKSFIATPEYFFCNPIPHNIGDSEKTPIIDKLFTEWVGEENKKILYEILGFCCVTDYPIHRIFCFYGSGCNGKSQYQRLLMHFIGVENICSTELDLLCDGGRFESVKLHKKLVCQMGETNLGSMNKTSMLKKLSGQDLIGFEYKNKLPFDGYNYAKILINTNSLPTTTDDSDGFKRRWLIISFPNQFEEGRDIISPIPEKEYENLAFKIIRILKELLTRGEFTGDGTIEQRREKYMMVSNPLPIFIKAYCVQADSENVFCRCSEFFTAYTNYLKKHKLRRITLPEFYKTMNEEGYERRRTFKLGERDIFFENIMLIK